jgi:hypothetical protein
VGNEVQNADKQTKRGMLRWEAKDFDFRCQIFQSQDQRIKRLKISDEECKDDMKLAGKYSPEVQVIRMPYTIRKCGIGVLRGKSSIMNAIWKFQSRQIKNEEEIPVCNEIRTIQWNQWISIMAPQYLLLPIPFLEDPNLNSIKSFSLDLIASTLLLHPILHPQRMIQLPHLSLPLTTADEDWNFNPTWFSWISPPAPASKKSSQISRLDLILPTLDDSTMKTHQTSHFFISALRPSILQIQLFLNSTSHILAFVNFVNEINSATVGPALLNNVNRNWLLSTRVTAPYYCVDKFQRKETNLLLSEAGDLALDEALPTKQTFPEWIYHKFILKQMDLKPILIEIKHLSHRFLPPRLTLGLIQHILLVSNQLMYFTRAECKVSRNWIYQSLCDTIRILAEYRPHRRLFQKKVSLQIVSQCLPSAPRDSRLYQLSDPLMYYFTRLDHNIRTRLLEKETLTLQNDLNPMTPNCSSMETPVEVSYEESKSCEIVSSGWMKCRTTPLPPPTVSHLESKTLEEVIPQASITENQLDNIQFVEIDNPGGQPQAATKMGDIIDSYFQLHGYPSDIGTSNPLKKTKDTDQLSCPAPKVITPPPLIHSFMISGSAPPHVSTDQMEGLMILISEDLLVQNPIYTTLLYQKYKIQCISAPLESPLAFIVDEITGICLLFNELLCSRERLKGFLRKLTSLVFKFNTIWLVIVSFDDMKVPHDTFASLCQSLTQFPCSVEIRFSDHLSVPSLIHSLCQEAANFVAVKKGVLLSTFKDRAMLGLLENMVFSAHCKLSSSHPW